MTELSFFKIFVLVVYSNMPKLKFKIRRNFMSESELIAQTERTFEDIKHVDENGNEYWYARELMISLGYKEWRYFDNVIEKSK